MVVLKVVYSGHPEYRVRVCVSNPCMIASWSRVINGLYMKWNRTVLLFLPFLLSFLSQSSLLIYNGPITKTSHFEREKEYRQVNIDRNHGNRVSKRH